MAATGWLGLTSLGIVHTAISLIAVIAGLIALFRYKEITLRTGWGRIFVWTTVLTCLTGFGIFQHGGFGKPHALGILTLAALAVGAAAGRGAFFGQAVSLHRSRGVFGKLPVPLDSGFYRNPDAPAAGRPAVAERRCA